MIVVMRMNAGQELVDAVVSRIEELGYRPHLSSGDERVIIGVIGNDRPVSPERFLSMAGVENVVPILAPYKLASRDMTAENSVISVLDATFGGDEVVMMAGPCSVESEEQTFRIAEAL